MTDAELQAIRERYSEGQHILGGLPAHNDVGTLLAEVERLNTTINSALLENNAERMRGTLLKAIET